jgi:hypothetical protein
MRGYGQDKSICRGRYGDIVRTMTLLIRQSDGSFRLAQNYSIPRSPISGTIVDLNHDGFPDLILADFLAIMAAQKSMTVVNEVCR